MTLRNLFLLLFFGAITVNSDVESGYFTVIGSKLMRPNKPYRVSLHHQGYSSENSLEIAVKGESFNDTRVVSFSSDGDKEVVFEPPQTLRGEYRLEVKSLSGANFESSRKIEVNRKQFSVFVQTDKSIYKPADKVQFRVLLLDSETRPYRASQAAVFVTDGAGNRVKQFDSPQFRHGVYENALQLSELPVLGKWKINVKVDGETTENSKEFEVAEYVLPKFEFTLDANPDANFKDGKITATARAKYTFGKVAKGNATITAEKRTQWWGDQSKKVTKTVAVDGKKFVEFDIENELGITQTRSEHTIELFATFTEELSGKEQNATAKVQIHITPHKIEMRKDGEKFKPGLNYKVTAIVKYHDKNAPVTDAQHPLNFTTKFFYDVDAKCKKYKHGPYGRRGGFGWRYDQDWSSESTNEEEEYECREEKSYETVREIFVKNGIAELDLEIPSNTTRINVEAKYQDTVVSVKGVEKEATKCNEYIQAKLLSPSPTLGKKIAIEVQSTDNLKQLTYQVIGSGSVIKSETVRTPDTKKFDLSFMPTVKMAPKSQVIVFYIASNGEMISDKVDIEFPAELRNQIDLQLSANQAKPGSDLEISVSTKPNSFVGLLGVDQSVLVLKKGNDIEASQVLNEQKKFGKMKLQQKNKSDYKDFKDAIIITNIKSEHKEVKKPLKDNYNYSPRFGMSSPGGGRHQIVAYSRPVFRANSGGSSASSSAAFYSGRTSFNAESISLSAPQNRIFGGDLDIRSEDFDDRSLIVESRPPKPRMQPKKPIEVRKVFPETWMFDSIQMAANESSVTLRKKVPDTITSWIVTGFSLNAVDGLGLTKEAAKLSVFQPFFVSTNLPYSVKRGEIAAIPVVVFNYLPVDQDVEVTFANGEREFEFVEPNEEENRVKRPQRRRRAIETERKKTLRVRSNEGASVRFMVRPLKVGHLTVKVTAESNAAGDAVEQPLLVIPEGVTHFENEAVLVDLRDEREFATSFDIFVPQSTVPDSIRIEAAATGDILGPSIENLDKLIKLPYGCGEQNMLNFVPNIVVLDYLTAVGKLSQEVEEKARGHLEIGYQRELSYKHNDGSYSAFGGSDSSGSTWLTAFVARSFNQASRYVDIEQKVIREALEFLRKVQSADGSFHEVGRILSKSMQGGASKGIALTAYTLITFLENMQHSRDFGDVIERAIEFILANMDSIEDDYSLAIASYALQLAQNRQRDEFLAKINGRAVNDNGLKFWKRSDAATAEDSKPDSVSVEMTAYALLAFVEAGRDTDALAIGKWLVAQRNENGGFQSTQDTVVGLQALAKLAAKIHTADGDVAITLRSSSAADGAAETRIKVDEGNALVLQKFELPPTARRFEVEASGRGLSLLQVSYRYNIADTLKRPRFTLEPTVGSDSNADYLRLTVCSRFVPPTAAGEGERSNMAVMEVSLPSGFTYDTDHVAELERSAQVKKVELKEGDTRVIVYFDSIGSGAHGEVCPEFKSYRTHGVAKQKPSPVVVYDYYDTSRAARAFYSPPTISLCDICSAGGDENSGENEECTELCESPAIDFSK